MSAVVTGTQAKLEALLPNKIGDNKTFTDAYVQELIMAGFYDVAEKTGVLTVTQSISLTANALLYDLDSSFIDVGSVEFKSDGTNVDGALTAVTLSDLDRKSRKWRDDRGTRPEYYSLLSAPGIPETSTDARDGSQILVWRPMSTVDAEIITINGIGIGNTSTSLPQDVQRLALVPYCLSHLKAQSDPQAAVRFRHLYNSGWKKIRGRYASRYTETFVSRKG